MKQVGILFGKCSIFIADFGGIENFLRNNHKKLPKTVINTKT